MIQEENETVDHIVTRPKQKASSFNDADSCDEFIGAQVIDKCRSVALKTKLLEKGQTLTLKDLQDISRAHEVSYFQASKINEAEVEVKKENVSYINCKRKEKSQKRLKASDENKCFRCGKTGYYAKL